MAINREIMHAFKIEVYYLGFKNMLYEKSKMQKIVYDLIQNKNVYAVFICLHNYIHSSSEMNTHREKSRLLSRHTLGQG